MSARFLTTCGRYFWKCPNELRFYSRNALRRKPIAVLNVPGQQTVAPEMENLTLDNSKLSKASSITLLGKEKGLIVPPYEKLQISDPRFTKVLGIIRNRKHREKYGKILLEGKRLINDAIQAGVQLQTIFFSREQDLAAINFRNQQNVKIHKVLYRQMKTWSDLTTCPGIMGVFSRPSSDDIAVLSEPTLPVTVICDNIREPGNLGSIIRNAAASGCKHILLMKGCVDPWESKVIRAGCGGHFRIPVANNIDWRQIATFIPNDAKLFIADNSADIEGTSDEAMGLIDFESVDESEDEKKYISLNECNQPVHVDETYDEPIELEKYEDVELPCYLYSSIKYPKENIVLYIGGETHGVDPRVKKLACEFGGKKIKIPMDNSMESINSAFAATIILYEIKRQLGETFITK